ncbi:hypothetical protein ABZ553_19475 [Streptomyces sparsogenes]|uniref:hypothetical protein n=1 Tax=Streptomyces sparsogenes TaxID=67365 RepID=UPI0033D3574B
MDRGLGADAQGVALAAPYGDALVERGALGGVRLGGAEEVGDLARHVEGDRQLRGRDVVVVGDGVLGHEVGDGRALDCTGSLDASAACRQTIVCEHHSTGRGGRRPAEHGGGANVRGAGQVPGAADPTGGTLVDKATPADGLATLGI